MINNARLSTKYLTAIRQREMYPLGLLFPSNIPAACPLARLIVWFVSHWKLPPGPEGEVEGGYSWKRPAQVKNGGGL